MRSPWLQIFHLNGQLEEHELKPPTDNWHIGFWGITALGCTFTLADGSFLIIHPKSVRMLRQVERE